MKNCYLCKTGKLVESGAHVFCDTCGYVQFKINADYLDSCCVLLGTLVSNSKFPTVDDLANITRQNIRMHLPQLQLYLDTVVNGNDETVKALLDTIKAHAINLQIVDRVHNPEELPNDLTCQCGCTKMHMIKVGELMCVGCEAMYVFEDNTYQPFFRCECGSITYAEQDASLVACTECEVAYIYDRTEKLFRVVMC